MRKVVVSEHLSLDGVMEEPAWTAAYRSDEIAKFKFDELFESDALLLGRVTYEDFAQGWPSVQDEQGFADRMNNLPKHVASRTLSAAEWNASIIKGEVAARVAELKQEAGANILVYGSGELVDSLIAANLVDEYHLMVFPVVLGKGKRLFKPERDTTLKLTESRVFGSGAILLIYRPADPAERNRDEKS